MIYTCTWISARDTTWKHIWKQVLRFLSKFIATVVLEQTDENKETIAIYETLVSEHYKKPVDED